MKTKTPLHRIAALFALALLATFGATHEAKAQYQVTTLGTAVVETFTSYSGTSAPTNWTIVNANNGVNTALFSFDNGFNSSWNSGTSTFTITAIPEPSTYLAAAGLLSLMLWPSRKRLLKDTKKILGLTPPMRDRLAARRAQKTRLEA